jgi:ABC-type histidine transport system ATPase subunit
MSTNNEKAIIEIKGLEKSFGDLKVLQGINFKAYPKEVISIIGSSGSGKSTFLRCMNFLESPCSGDLNILNHNFYFPLKNKKQDFKELRKKVAMVFQQFFLWPHMTVLENIIEVPIHVHGLSKEEAIKKAHECLEKVGVLDKKDSYPLALSGGQKQRVAIARALAVDPEIILFDEPTSALDPELVGEVLKVIKSLAEEGRSMLIVTHEMNFAKEVSDRVLFLHKGKIEVDENAETFFQNPPTERLKQFLSHQY